VILRRQRTPDEVGPFRHAYRLRIASVIRDYGMNDRAQVPKDSKAVHGHQAA
jgi:hypothetical protein